MKNGQNETNFASRPLSYGLIEGIGMGKMGDHDEDGDYYDDCQEALETCANWSIECYLFPRPNGDRD